jgi:aminoglycoside phosphotransferase (APT) family kinase protein
LFHDVNKDQPSAEWIGSLRRRFVTEKAIDKLLTRKMELRSGPGFRPIKLPELKNAVENLIRANIGDHFSVTDARWMSGGASKLQMSFNLEWNRPGIGFEKTAMVLRMEPAESIVETSRLREFQLIKAVDGTAPVPPAFWCDENATYLPYPGLVYGFAPGVTKPSSGGSGVTGLGIRLSGDLQKQLGEQFVDNLAKIHNLDFRSRDLSAFDIPAEGTQCAEWGVNWWERVWEEDGDEDVPLMAVANGWLRDNMPSLSKPCIVHADYRTGNFLFTEHDAQITAVLDWELGRIGDRHQDLAWVTSCAFQTPDPDGKAPLVCGLMPETAFLEAYEQRAGVKVDPKTLHWYRVYNDYSIVVLLLATGYRIARNGKTHQDILVAWLIGLGGQVLDELRELIEKEI